MGEFISLSEASLIAIVSIVSVFIILIIIAFIISALRAFSGEKKEMKTQKTQKVETMEKSEIVEEKEELEDPNMLSEELVVAITAAIASSLGRKTPDIKIKSIKRLPQTSSNWSTTGTIKQVMGKL